MQRLRDSFRELANSEFYRNIAGLFSGIFAARLVPALFALIIARLYAPEHFGDFVLFLTIASFISILATGGYERALLLASDENDKRHIFSFAMKVNLVVNLVVAILLLIVAWLGSDWRTGRMINLLLVPIYSFFFGSVQLVRNLLISTKSFKKLSALEFLRAILGGIAQTAFFIWPEAGLFLGITLSQIVTYFYYSLKLPAASGIGVPRFREDEIRLAKRYVNFPKFSVPSEMFNFLSSQLPVFMIKPFFGEMMLGLYSFSHRYLSIPVQLTSISIGSVYVQKAQSLKDDPSALSALTADLFRKQFRLAVIPFTVLTLWGEEIFTLLFGIEWAFSGQLAQIMAPWLFAVYIGSPLATILVVREKQRISMIYNITLLAARALALLAGGLWLKDISLTIGLFSAIGFLFFTGLTLYSFRLANVKWSPAFRFVIIQLLIMAVPLILLKLWL
jgi:O-antigen/teichoic acid export membrane protein